MEHYIIHAVPLCTTLCSSSGFIPLKTRKRTQGCFTIGTPKLGSMSFCRTSRLILSWTRRTNYAVLLALTTCVSLGWIPMHKVTLSETGWWRVKLPKTGMSVCSFQLFRRAADDSQVHFVRLKFHTLADYTVLWGNLETDRRTSFSTIWQYDVYTCSKFPCAHNVDTYFYTHSHRLCMQFLRAHNFVVRQGMVSLETWKWTQCFLAFGTPNWVWCRFVEPDGWSRAGRNEQTTQSCMLWRPALVCAGFLRTKCRSVRRNVGWSRRRFVRSISSARPLIIARRISSGWCFRPSFTLLMMTSFWEVKVCFYIAQY